MNSGNEFALWLDNDRGDKTRVSKACAPCATSRRGIIIFSYCVSRERERERERERGREREREKETEREKERESEWEDNGRAIITRGAMDLCRNVFSLCVFS